MNNKKPSGFRKFARPTTRSQEKNQEQIEEEIDRYFSRIARI
jgi:hypothetical protein